MSRRLAVALLVLAAASARAQDDRFIAPTSSSITASPEQSMGEGGRTLFFVENHSTVPIIVYGFTLSSCENVKQWCGGQRVNVPVPPGARRQIGRVDAKSPERATSYRWSYAWRADSSDAKIAELMRRNGLGGAEPSTAEAPTPAVAPAEPAAPETPAEAAVAAGAVRPASSDDAAMRPLVSAREIEGIAQASSAIAPTRQFYVTNKSRYAVVVYSFNLENCANVKQVCGRTPIEVHLKPGARAQIARVDAQDRKRKYTYDWTYDWRMDTTDVATAAAMRARGLREGSLGRAENLATPAPADTTSRRPAFLDANNRPVATAERFRFRVARGSILASAKTPGATALATGACIDPAELAGYERDTTITSMPAQKPALRPGGLTLPTLTAAQRDSLGTGIVTMRWVVDTTGTTIPGSVRVVDSPLGSLSVQMCAAVIGAYLSPARDADGRPIRTWVEAPIRVVR